jgi:phage I-like protein
VPHIATLHSTLAGAAPPEWVHLVPAGRFTGADGRGPYTLGDAQAVISASLPDGAKLPIDENHATDVAAPKGGPSPARGWIVAMETRPDGIWGRVEWTEEGRRLVADHAYRGISPVFVHSKSGDVQRILRAALTNTPNLEDLATLNSQGSTMDLVKLRAALGLGADADEAAILAAAEQQRSAHASQAVALTSLQSQLAQMQTAAIKPETVTALQSELATLKATQAKDRAVAFVDGAIKAGKPIAPLRDHYIARHSVDAEAVEKEVGALVSINAGGLDASGQPARHDTQDGDGLTEMESKICRNMGLDRKKFAEQLKKQKAA